MTMNYKPNHLTAACRNMARAWLLACGLVLGLVLGLGLSMGLSMGLALAAQRPAAPLVSAEEFNGPFAGWKNLKTDFGAVGDGKADDTAALKAALEKVQNGQVLYLPAGTYRVTQPFVWSNRKGVALLGEDPAKTIVRYDGPAGEAMLTLHGVSYSKFGRITWDGQGKARAAVAHQWNPVTRFGPPGTSMEHADEVFMNVGRGIIGGAAVPVIKEDATISHYNHGMDAETLVKRCKFIRCSEAGLSIESFNALDWWVWDSEFLDCGVGATNCAKGEYGGGHFHLYRNVFRGSKVADIRTGHTSYFGFRFNTSIGSRRFLETIRPEGYGKDNYFGKWKPEDAFGSRQAVQGNRILNPLDPTPIFVNQHGPLLLLDNIFVVKPEGDKPVVQVTPPTDGARCISIGNRFYGASRVEVKGELIEQDNETLAYAKADLAEPYLTPTSPRTERRIIEIKAGATGAEIQAVIDEAAKLAGQKPVIHLPAGRYPVSATLRIPAGADLQLIGDGEETTLIWEGSNEGAMLHLAGPARATLRDFRIAGIWNSKGQILGRGIVAENLDQPDGQILLDQVGSSYCTRQGMLVDGLTQTRVEAQGGGPGGNTGPGLTVIGGGDKTTAWMGFFGGAGSNNQQTHVVKNGGKLVVWDTWYETAMSTKDSEPRYIHLTDRGNLTFFNGKIATLPGKEARQDLASVDLDGFVGHFTLIGAEFDTRNPQIRLAGTGEGMKTLVLGTGFCETNPYLDNQAPAAKVAVLASTQNHKNLPTIGKLSPEFLREMLKDARTVLPTRWQPAPAGSTDLRLHRVTVSNKVGEGIVFSAGGK
jgi:hypothetical protein